MRRNNGMPRTALRAGTVQKAYFTQELPRQFRGYVIFVGIWNVLVGLLALAMLAKKNWARLWLVVVK